MKNRDNESISAKKYLQIINNFIKGVQIEESIKHEILSDFDIEETLLSWSDDLYVTKANDLALKSQMETYFVESNIEIIATSSFIESILQNTKLDFSKDVFQ